MLNSTTIGAALLCVGCVADARNDGVDGSGDETDAGPTRNAVTDNCEVVGDSACEADCMPIFSSSAALDNHPCIADGVFFGCVPRSDSDFWKHPPDEPVPTQWGHCDTLRDDPKQIVYCFEGDFALYWVYRHIALFCDGGCAPSLEPCSGQYEPNG